MRSSEWSPPTTVSHEDIAATSARLLAAPGVPIREHREILEIGTLDLSWDIATHVVEPEHDTDQPRGADGRRIGALILHGGLGDHREKLPMARFLASRFGYRVVLMSYPGRYYFSDPEGRWPGDTIDPDGSVRVPMWKVDQVIGRDQYEVVRDRSDPIKRAKWGTLTFAAARPGTDFHDRMAAWPVAFEDAIAAVCARRFPESDFSIYMHGHSTGGPFAHVMLQRVPNVVGLLGAESSSFPFIYRAGIGMAWTHPFNYLAVMSWRNVAMYRGPEAGPDVQWRLPWVMEQVLEEWESVKHQAYFKAEYIVTYAATPQLEAAARAAALRLGLSDSNEAALVQRYLGYVRELTGPGVRPVPPLLLGIVKGSRDHTPERYQQVVLPRLAAMRPAPKVHLVRYEDGVHEYDLALPGSPLGVFPAIAQVWDDAIRQGFFVTT
jgi:hypothetical protein